MLRDYREDWKRYGDTDPCFGVLTFTDHGGVLGVALLAEKATGALL